MTKGFGTPKSEFNVAADDVSTRGSSLGRAAKIGRKVGVPVLMIGLMATGNPVGIIAGLGYFALKAFRQLCERQDNFHEGKERLWEREKRRMATQKQRIGKGLGL